MTWIIAGRAALPDEKRGRFGTPTHPSPSAFRIARRVAIPFRRAKRAKAPATDSGRGFLASAGVDPGAARADIAPQTRTGKKKVTT